MEEKVQKVTEKDDEESWNEKKFKATVSGLGLFCVLILAFF